MGVVGAQLFLINSQRTFEERLGLGITALVLVHPGQVVEFDADYLVVGAPLLVNSQCALEERLGLGVATLGVVQPAKHVEHKREIMVIGACRLLDDCQQTLGQRDRLRVIASIVEIENLFIEPVGVLRHSRWSEYEPPRHHHPRHRPRETRHKKPLPLSNDQPINYVEQPCRRQAGKGSGCLCRMRGRRSPIFSS